ncbi:MAG TPA: PhnD/SsuA/transferrin family substrate-binding protein [Actinomycetota bacterium]|nr:PhnD/SsuA/transferrin family substrate-binding protein [Actinomycetota bacterium]
MTAGHGPPPLRLATFLAPNMQPLYRFLADHLAARLDRPVELVVGTSFAQFQRGQADVGVICGLPYVWLAAQRPPPVEPLAAPVLSGERYGGRPIYFSDVIVRRDSPLTRLEDLRGCSWAYNDPTSHSGYTLTLHALVRMGARPGFFGRLVQAGYHERSVELVARGEVDASAIDSQVLAVALRDQPELAAGLRVVDTFGPSTIQPVVVASRLPEPVKIAVRDALLDLDGRRAAEPGLAHGFVERFVAIDDGDYDDIRAMLAAIRAAGFTTLS